MWKDRLRHQDNKVPIKIKKYRDPYGLFVNIKQQNCSLTKMVKKFQLFSPIKILLSK